MSLTHTTSIRLQTEWIVRDVVCWRVAFNIITECEAHSLVYCLLFVNPSASIEASSLYYKVQL